jgi:signal transduction histidine kinase
VAFVAVRASDDVVLRLALPLSQVDSAIREMRLRLLVAGLLGLAGAVGIGLVVSRIAGTPLRAMRTAARDIAAGGYDVRLPPPTPDDFGELSSALGELARQLKSVAQRIDRLEAMRREFVANLSHEIRTPLAALSGYAETLTSTDQDEDTRRRALLAIERHARRLDALASGLLRLSEVEASDPRDLLREPVDLAAVSRHVAASADRRAPEGHAPIVVDVEGDAIPRADPLAVEQVLDNLVGNALAHAGDRAAIRVIGRRVGDDVVVEVIDDGVGVAAEHLPRLFDRFYRADKARGAGGTGLGLAITKHLVEAMEGTIAIESEPGSGTRAIVRLPATPR